MKKAIWLLPLALLLACGPSAATADPAAEQPEDTIEVESNRDEADESPASAPSAADLGNFAPAGSVEEAAEIRVQDWRKGADDPTVVIIEYSDFQ